MYHLFMGNCYYPLGGMRDYVGSFSTVQDAKQFVYEFHASVTFGSYYDSEWCGDEWAIIAEMCDGKLKTILEYGWLLGRDGYGDDSYLVWRETN